MKLKKMLSLQIVFCMIFSSLGTLKSTAEEKSIFENSKTSSESANHLIPAEKISEELYKEMESSKELIPVFVWYKDIDQSEIETIVKERTGITNDTLEIKNSAPSEELLNELAKAAYGTPTKYLELLMSSYMELTASERAIEKELTDLYIDTLRAVIHEKIIAQGGEVVSELGIQEKPMLYVSQYAPMFVTLLTADEIKAASENSKIESLSLHVEPDIVECTFPNTTVKTTMGVNQIDNKIGLKGNGVSIGIYETSTVSSTDASNFELNMNKVTIVGPTLQNGSSHATWCASVAAGNKGIAPNAAIYSSTVEYDWQGYQNSRRC